MELRSYWDVIRRRWKTIAAVVVATLLVSVTLALRGPSAYTAQMRLAISIVPEPKVGEYFRYDSYYSVLTSEYLADDLSEVLKSDAFAIDVSEEMARSVDPAQIVSLTRTKKTHRLLDVTITDSDPDRALAICQAFEAVLNKKLGQYFAFLQVNNGYVRIVNRPEVKRTNPPLLLVAEIALRTIAGLVVGIGLAFVFEYVDDRLRDRGQVESIVGLPVLGEIPAS